MSRDWTKDELQAASATMKAMGFETYEEFCAELERMKARESAETYRYYIQVPHVTADRVPAGYTRFESWSSKPYCKDAGREAFGVVEFPRPLTVKEMTVCGLCVGKI